MYLIVSLTPCETTFSALRAVNPERASPASSAASALNLLCVFAVRIFFGDACPALYVHRRIPPCSPLFSALRPRAEKRSRPVAKGFCVYGFGPGFSPPLFLPLIAGETRQGPANSVCIFPALAPYAAHEREN